MLNIGSFSLVRNIATKTFTFELYPGNCMKIVRRREPWVVWTMEQVGVGRVGSLHCSVLGYV
jgi:hypothetical protein